MNESVQKAHSITINRCVSNRVFHVLIVASAFFLAGISFVCGVFVAFVKTRVICFLVGWLVGGCLCGGEKAHLRKKRLLSLYPILTHFPFIASLCFHRRCMAFFLLVFMFVVNILTLLLHGK